MRIEYIWPDGSSDPGLRTKTRFADTVEPWSYDGSSTGEASVEDSDIMLLPIREYYKDGQCTKYVLCETETLKWGSACNENGPLLVQGITSSRLMCPTDDDWMFGFEQEFFLVTPDMISALNSQSFEPQSKYYCGLGTEFVRDTRHVIDNIVHDLQGQGINVTGTNAEVAPGQWEIQILGNGIKAADDLLMTRYMILVHAERNGLHAIFVPKPFENWNGSGLHCNFSTPALRDIGGKSMMEEYIKALKNTHEETFDIYGDGNKLRLTGSHEAPDMETFNFGARNRSVSIRIPISVIKNGYKGYLEDRRPGANADPYKVIRHIVRSIKTVPHILKEQVVKAAANAVRTATEEAYDPVLRKIRNQLND